MPAFATPLFVASKLVSICHTLTRISKTRQYRLQSVSYSFSLTKLQIVRVKKRQKVLRQGRRESCFVCVAWYNYKSVKNRRRSRLAGLAAIYQFNTWQVPAAFSIHNDGRVLLSLCRPFCSFPSAAAPQMMVLSNLITMSKYNNESHQQLLLAQFISAVYVRRQ